MKCTDQDLANLRRAIAQSRLARRHGDKPYGAVLVSAAGEVGPAGPGGPATDRLLFAQKPPESPAHPRAAAVHTSEAQVLFFDARLNPSDARLNPSDARPKRFNPATIGF